jgi:hypothetical protein
LDVKKTYPTSNKAKEWAKHLRKEGKRRANKGTRQQDRPTKHSE